MAIFTGTYHGYAAQGLREDLSEMIYNIDPTETPLTTMIGKNRCDSTLYEWQTEALTAAVTTNHHLEGDDITDYGAGVQTVRVGNYTQISRKLIAVSGTLEARDKAGRASEMAHQLKLKGKEIRRDVEATIFTNRGANAGGATTERQTATLGAWLKTNADLGTSGAVPTYTSGVPAAARTDGTNRAFTETILKTVLREVWTNSSVNPKALFVGPVDKAIVSGFGGIATLTYNMNQPAKEQATIMGAASVYVLDFGNIQVIRARLMREEDGYIIDPAYLAICALRPYRVEKMAKTGDAEKRMLLFEWGLQVHQEAAHGICGDLNG